MRTLLRQFALAFAVIGALAAPHTKAFALPDPGPAAATTSATPPATTPGAVPVGAALQLYQVALDQLSLGRITEARVVAERARKAYGDTPEINLLLTYLLL